MSLGGLDDPTLFMHPAPFAKVCIIHHFQVLEQWGEEAQVLLVCASCQFSPHDSGINLDGQHLVKTAHENHRALEVRLPVTGVVLVNGQNVHFEYRLDQDPQFKTLL